MKDIRYELLLILNPLINKHGFKCISDNLTQLMIDMNGTTVNLEQPPRTMRRKRKRSTAGSAGKGGPFYEHFKCAQRIKDLMRHAGQNGVPTSEYEDMVTAEGFKKMVIGDMLKAEQDLRDKLGRPMRTSPGEINRNG